MAPVYLLICEHTHIHTRYSKVPVSLGRVCVCIWDGTPRGAILLFTQEKLRSVMLVFLPTMAQQEKQVYVPPLCSGDPKGKCLSGFSVADKEGRIVPG